jgi:hypothetical protein
MISTNFPEANATFGPPNGMSEEQVNCIKAYLGYVGGGSCDGSTIVVTAWKPSPEELTDLLAGKPVFLTCLGGLPPHCLTTDFKQAISLA